MAHIKPMTLGNMVSTYADDLPVPSFGPRMVCTVCGAIGADARPNWNERAPLVYSDGQRRVTRSDDA